MLRLGDKSISKLFLGDRPILKAYLGDKLVYQANKPIFLDYVHFDGNSYINTGIALQTCTIETAVKYESGHSRRMLNGWLGNLGLYWGMTTNGSFELAGSGLSRTTNLTDYTEIKIKYDLTTNVVTPTVDDVTQSFNINGTTRELYTIGCSVPSSGNKVIGNVYYHRFTNADGEVIQDLRPCIDPDGTVCFYDMVTKEYFYNQGTGTLTAGNKINFIDYIITDGLSYIDTEYCPNENTYIEYTCELTEMPTQSFQGLFGSRQATSTLEYSIFARNNKYFRLDFGRYFEPTPTYPITLNTKLAFKAGLGEIYINDELVKSYTPKVGQSPYSMYLGNFNQVDSPYTNGTPQKIYTCKIWENNILVRDLRPCVVAGEACFYDMVTGKVFTNAGTGALKASGRFVESIIFDGASYINTDIAHQTCTIKTTIKFEETGTRQLMGFGSSSGQYWGKAANQTTFEYFGGTNAMDKTDVVLEYMCDDPTAPYLIMHADGKSRTGTAGTKISEFPYIIGCLKTSLTSTTIYYPCTIEVWRNTTIIDGKIVQDLKPYVDENGVACFKDVVTNTLFYNKGTGTLGYTE